MSNRNKELWKKAKQVIPGGNQLLSKRPYLFTSDYWPTYFRKAKGCEVIDLENKKYFDFSRMAVGACALGYSDNFVNNAVKKVINNSNVTTLNSPLEVELAETLLSINKWAGMVKYARTGAEANAIAVRIARAYTGKNKILVCGYHGWQDWYISAIFKHEKNINELLLPNIGTQGIPKELSGLTIPFKYNNIEDIEKKIKANNGQIAAIMMESEREEKPYRGYLKEVENICKKNNILLIFDEITSAFRTYYGGHFNNYGIKPDIVTYGKALGNGYAINAIVGKKDVMNKANETFISSTNWTEAVGFAAALATLQKMKKINLHTKLLKIGKRVELKWYELGDHYNVPISIRGIGPVMFMRFEGPKNIEVMNHYTQLMLNKGFLAANYFYACNAHSNTMINKYFDALESSFKKIKSKYY